MTLQWLSVRKMLAIAISCFVAVPSHLQAADPAEAIDPQFAADACGLPATAVLDASQIPVPGELAAKVSGIGAQGVVISGGHFNGEDFAPFAAQLSGACFYRTQLSNTDWESATATDMTFIQSDLSGAVFRNAKLDRAKFVGVNASQADFSGASLVDAHWRGAFWTANLKKARFAGADMRRFRFSCGITMDASCGGTGDVNFSAADLTASDLSEFPIWGFDDFSQARLDGATLSASAVPHLGDVLVETEVSLATVEDADPVTLSSSEFAVLKSASEDATRDVASFDCNKAASAAEIMICGPYESRLRSRDRDLAALYAIAKARGKTTARGQRIWLRSRNRCADAACIEQAYDARITVLFARTAGPVAVAPDETWEFAEDVLPVTEEMRASALYARLRPALVWASMQSVAITGLEDGSLHASGDAVGANAHTCSMSVPQASYDRDTGWYAGQLEGPSIPVFRIWGDRLIPRYSGNADTPIEAMGFVSCGARAGFGELRRLPDPLAAP